MNQVILCWLVSTLTHLHLPLTCKEKKRKKKQTNKQNK